MKKYEVIVEDAKAEELKAMLEKLPYVKKVQESEHAIDVYTLASEESLSQDWLSEDDDDSQKLYGK